MKQLSPAGQTQYAPPLPTIPPQMCRLYPEITPSHRIVADCPPPCRLHHREHGPRRSPDIPGLSRRCSWRHGRRSNRRRWSRSLLGAVGHDAVCPAADVLGCGVAPKFPGDAAGVGAAAVWSASRRHKQNARSNKLFSCTNKHLNQQGGSGIVAEPECFSFSAAVSIYRQAAVCEECRPARVCRVFPL